jgi:esterase/lipase superfamily enzyme
VGSPRDFTDALITYLEGITSPIHIDREVLMHDVVVTCQLDQEAKNTAQNLNQILNRTQKE